MSVRHFIQHIGGDPIALRFVEHDTLREGADGTWTAEWTTEPEQRAEWLDASEARTFRDRLGVGIVRHTAPEALDIDEAAARQERLHPPPEPPPSEPIPDADLPWWQRL